MNTSEIASYLGTHPIFKKLDSKYRRQIADFAKQVSFNDGTLLFHQDDKADYFYIMLEGEVSVEIPAIYGGPINMQTLGPNDVLGWSWLFPPYKWHFNARAVEPTEALQFDGQRLREKCDQDPRLGLDLMKAFSELMMERLNASRKKIMEVYGPS